MIKEFAVGNEVRELWYSSGCIGHRTGRITTSTLPNGFYVSIRWSDISSSSMDLSHFVITDLTYLRSLRLPRMNWKVGDTLLLDLPGQDHMGGIVRSISANLYGVAGGSSDEQYLVIEIPSQNKVVVLQGDDHRIIRYCLGKPR
jgi:hypothetical protein